MMREYKLLCNIIKILFICKPIALYWFSLSTFQYIVASLYESGIIFNYIVHLFREVLFTEELIWNIVNLVKVFINNFCILTYI